MQNSLYNVLSILSLDTVIFLLAMPNKIWQTAILLIKYLLTDLSNN